MTGGRVVVLGRTGRNFAAGMSGGIAYVLDEDGGFRGRCNTELVGFDPLEERTSTSCGARRGARRAHGLDGRRPGARRLGSAVARFVKVMPHDYKRALADLEAEPKGTTRPRPAAAS